jgi:hypothetical protein
MKNVSNKRKGFTWNVNEINRLYNEYELKELGVYEIAKLHQRDVKGILYKLSDEGLIDNLWDNARGWDNKTEVKKTQVLSKRSSPRNNKSKVSFSPVKKECTLIISELDDESQVNKIQDFTGEESDDCESYDNESDDEYTLDDAKKDYSPYSFTSKCDFFENITPRTLMR